MKRLVVILCVMLLQFALAGSGQCRGTLRVAASEFPPSVIFDDDGTVRGYDALFLGRLAEGLNLRLKIEHYPFQRALRLLQTGEVDAMLGVQYRPEREQFAYYLNPPYVTEATTAFYVLSGKENLIRKYEDLYGLTVGTSIGVKYFPRFDNDPRLRKEPVRGGKMNFLRLLAGRVDAVAMDDVGGDYRVWEFGLTDKVCRAKYMSSEPQNVYFVLSRRSRFMPRREEFEEVLAQLLRTGVREQCMLEHINQEAALTGQTPPEPILAGSKRLKTGIVPRPDEPEGSGHKAPPLSLPPVCP